MNLLTIPNWSFGRNRHLARAFNDLLEVAPVTTHFCAGDVDHNRTVTAFSGPVEAIEVTLLSLCEIAFDTIDLTRHMGVHPRIGALDVCPFVLESEGDLSEALAFADHIAATISERWDVPMYLYEKSERGRHESDLPTLRRGGFGSLIGKELSPDYGPSHAHPHLGVTVIGVRDFLIAMNVNLSSDDLGFVKALAKEIRDLRSDGDPRFLGVRALGVPLASRHQVQVSMNVTLPDITPIDPILEWVSERAARARIKVAQRELIGVIRPQDLPTASQLPVKPSQVVPYGRTY